MHALATAGMAAGGVTVTAMTTGTAPAAPTVPASAAPAAGTAARTAPQAGPSAPVSTGADTGSSTTSPTTSPTAGAPAVADTTVATAPSAAAAPSMPATAAAPGAQKSASAVSFPLRPATTASTQATPAVGHASAADAGSIGGALFSLVLVVGLILALGWLAKRMPGVQRGAGNAQLRVVASVALGPRDRAVVVDVGGTQLLLGVGQGGVRALHTLEQPLPAVETPGAPSPFAQILAQHFGRKP